MNESNFYWLALVEVYFLRGETPGAYRAQFTVRSPDAQIPAKLLKETQLRGIQMAVQTLSEGEESKETISITDATIVNMIPLGCMTQDEFNEGMQEEAPEAANEAKKPGKKATVTPLKPRHT